MKIYMGLFNLVVAVSVSLPAFGWLQENWGATKQWSTATEHEYVQYVKDRFKPDFFVQRNYWTDCADAAISLRNIFAYDNGYPLAYQSPGRTGKLNVLTKGSRSQLQKFMDEMRSAVSTRTIFNDTYPVRIHKDYLVPGGIFLYPAFHTEVISQVERRGRIRFLSSSMPPKVRELKANTFYEKDIPLYHPEISWIKKTDGGFRYPKRPIMQGDRFIYVYDIVNENDASSIEDQFRHGGINMSDFVAELIARSYGEIPPNDEEKMAGLLVELQQKFNDRIEVVCEGYRYCGGRPSMTSGPCDRGLNGSYSTPGRDTKMQEVISHIKTIVFAYRTTESSVLSPTRMADRLQALPMLFDPLCTGGSRLTFLQALLAFHVGYPSSDPVDEPTERWGYPVYGEDEVRDQWLSLFR